MLFYKDLLFVGFSFLLTFLFILQPVTAGVMIQSPVLVKPAPDSDRVPVPLPPPAPTELPNCPNDYWDGACTMYGIGFDPNAAAALGEALLSCDSDTRGCFVSQEEEKDRNKVRCVEVPGCTLKYQVYYATCIGGCEPPLTDQDETMVWCEANGKVDYLGYRCDRGPKKPWEQLA